MCIALSTTVAHNIIQNRASNFPSYRTDNRHCSDDVYLREGGADVPQLRTAGFCWSNVLPLAVQLLTATSAYELEKRCYCSPQQCYLHCLRTITGQIWCSPGRNGSNGKQFAALSKVTVNKIPTSPVVSDVPRPRGKHTVWWYHLTECVEVVLVSALHQIDLQIYTQR